MFKMIFVLLLGIASTDVQAAAAKYHVFFDDGCEHPVETCAIQTQLPRKLVKKQEFASYTGYQGTVQVAFADKNEAGIDAYDHYFADPKSCARALKTQKCDE